MRKDEFKNKMQAEMTAEDLDCPQLFRPRWKGKAKKLFRKIARKRIKEDLLKEEEDG